MRLEGGEVMKRMKIKMDKGKSFKEGFQEYLFNCKARGLREETIRHYEQSYIQLIKYIEENIEISDINKTIFDSFIVKVGENKEISSQTLFTYARDLKTVINFFIRQEYSRTFTMKLPRVDKQPIATYDEELEKLLKKPNINLYEYEIMVNY